jgi:hypothetical protein
MQVKLNKQLWKALVTCAALFWPAGMHAQVFIDSYITYDPGMNYISGYSHSYHRYGPEISGDSTYITFSVPNGEESFATGQWSYYRGYFYAILLPSNPAHKGNSVSEIVGTLLDSCAQQDPTRRYHLILNSGSTWWIGNPYPGGYGNDGIGIESTDWPAYYSQLIRDGQISPCGWYGTQSMSYSRWPTGGSTPYENHGVALTLDGYSVTVSPGNASQSTAAPISSMEVLAAKAGQNR